MELYTQLHNNTVPEFNDKLNALWTYIMSDSNHNVILGLIDNIIISSCVMIVVPNLTHNQRPYALIENVITHKDHRGKGENHCFKIMLMTGSKNEDTLSFYERAGFNKTDKTAFIQWLNP